MLKTPNQPSALSLHRSHLHLVTMADIGVGMVAWFLAIQGQVVVPFLMACVAFVSTLVVVTKNSTLDQ